MRQFTTSINVVTTNIQLAPSVTSDEVIVQPFSPSPDPPGPDPSPDDDNGLRIWAIIGFIALGLFVLLIVAAIIHYCYD